MFNHTSKSLFSSILLTACCANHVTAGTEVDLSGHIVERDYGSFISVVDCDSGLAIAEYAEVRSGEIDHPRYKRFFTDSEMEGCGQTSNKTYPKKISGIAYHRGHLLSSDVMDDSADRIRSTNVMTNIVPQLATNNRSGGAWYEIEDQIRCVRKKTRDNFIGLIVGTLNNHNTADDYFLSTHSVQTPDDLYKIAIFPNQEIRAWIVSNTRVSKSGEVDSLMVSPSEIIEKVESDYAKKFIENHLPTQYHDSVTFEPIHCS